MKRIIYLLVFSCLLVGCSKENDEIETVKDTVSLQVTNVTLEQNISTESIRFTTSGNWTAMVASNATSWCSLSAASGGAGTHTLTITVADNESYDERNASITISCGAAKAVFTVTQKQKDALIVNSNKIEQDAEGGDFVITARANVSVTYEIEESAKAWIDTNQNRNTRGLTETTFHFTTQANTSLDARQGNIIIRGENGLTETVTVYQKGENPTLVLNSPDKFTVGSEGETIKLELQSNLEYEIIFPDIDWIEEAKTRSVSSYTHYFTVKPNEEYDSREATIEVRSLTNNLSETLTIMQLQKDAIVIAKNTYEVDSEETLLELSINSNVFFETNLSEEWLSISEDNATRALVERKLILKIAKNPSTEERTGVLTLSFGDIEQKITIVQEGRNDVMRLVIVHSEDEFSPVELQGKIVKGTVKWGDGTESEVGQGHVYGKSGEKTTTFETWGVDVVIIDALKSISSITVFYDDE